MGYTGSLARRLPQAAVLRREPTGSLAQLVEHGAYRFFYVECTETPESRVRPPHGPNALIV
jgi:hypothetical protein